MADAVKSAVKSNNYKILKESFYANLNGGSIWEINAITLTLPVSISFATPIITVILIV
jgi:hypothetical protein